MRTPPDNEVKIGNGRETKIIMMRHAPRVGSDITVGGETWKVLSVSHEIPYRVQSMSFIARQDEAS